MAESTQSRPESGSGLTLPVTGNQGREKSLTREQSGRLPGIGTVGGEAHRGLAVNTRRETFQEQE